MHLSIAVPSSCGNRCYFCIAAMQKDEYSVKQRLDTLEAPRHEKDYVARMAYARDAGCSSLTLTGEGEPLRNPLFLRFIGECNRQLPNPFQHIQLQTSGARLSLPFLVMLRDEVGVTGISLSLCPFNSAENAAYTRPILRQDILPVGNTCEAIVEMGFVLRLCLNLTDLLYDLSIKDLLTIPKNLGASQVTFRVLYDSGTDSKENQWIREHRFRRVEVLREYLQKHGRPLPVLSSGILHYSINGLSVVVDDDCMSQKNPKEIRTMVLREDWRLYSRWDDKGSIIF